MEKVVCPYCGNEPSWVDNAAIYGRRYLWRALLTDERGFTVEASEYMKKDLPTHARDLYLAFQSLSH